MLQRQRSHLRDMDDSRCLDFDEPPGVVGSTRVDLRAWQNAKQQQQRYKIIART